MKYFVHNLKPTMICEKDKWVILSVFAKVFISAENSTQGTLVLNTGHIDLFLCQH